MKIENNDENAFGLTFKNILSKNIFSNKSKIENNI